MRFVGREKEIARIQNGLLHGQNVIISGKYGIGRTCLVERIAELNRHMWRFVFVDYSDTASQACRRIFLQLFPQQVRQSRDLPYKTLRREIARFSRNQQDLVLVIDNVSALSHQKLALLRYWRSQGSFCYILIVEASLPDAQRMKMHNCLGPATNLILDRLTFTSVKEFFAKGSEKYELGLQPADIHSMAEAVRGYPLYMTHRLNSELQRRASEQLQLRTAR